MVRCCTPLTNACHPRRLTPCPHCPPLPAERADNDALRKELLALKLMLAESEEGGRALESRCREAEARVNRDAAELAALRASSAESSSRLAEVERQLSGSRQQQEGLIKELGTLGSRCVRLQNELEALQRSRRQPQAAGASTSGGGAGSSSAGAAAAGPLNGGGTTHSRSGSQGNELSTSAAAAAAATPPQLPPSHSVSADSATASAAAAAAPSSLQHAADGSSCSNHHQQQEQQAGDLSRLSHLVSWLETERDALVADAAALQQQVVELTGERQVATARLRRLTAQPDALAACSVSVLRELEQELDASARAVRAAIMEAQWKASAEQHLCAVCMERPKGIVFSCGHQVCDDCSGQFDDAGCPFCRQPISARIRLFDS